MAGPPPLGNQNAANGRKWKAAIDRALALPSKVDGKHRLDEIAEEFVNQALAGERWAIEHLGDRIDGRVAQAVTLAGEDGGPIRTSLTVEFVGAIPE